MILCHYQNCCGELSNTIYLAVQAAHAPFASAPPANARQRGKQVLGGHQLRYVDIRVRDTFVLRCEPCLGAASMSSPRPSLGTCYSQRAQLLTSAVAVA